MKSLMKMIGLAALVLFSLALPQTASAITCQQVYTSTQGFSGWPYNQYTQYCGASTLTDAQSMVNAVNATQGYAHSELARAGVTYYLFHTPAEYQTYAQANGLTYVTPAAGAFGVTYFNTQKVPVYSAVFEQNSGNTFAGNVPHSTGQQVGGGLNYLLGYITNGGVVPPTNISAGDNVLNSKKVNVFQQQLANDWASFNNAANVPCFNTAKNSNGVFSGYADSTSTSAKVNYICSDNPSFTTPNGLGTTLSAAYANDKTNEAIIQQAWPDIYGTSAGPALFGEEYSNLYLGNDGSTTSTPRSADTYLNAYFHCSEYFVKNMGDQGLIQAPSGCAVPQTTVATNCFKLFSSPYQWPAGNVLNCAGTNDPNANTIYNALLGLGNQQQTYTPVKQAFAAAQGTIYVFTNAATYLNVFDEASQPPANLAGAVAGTYQNKPIWYTIVQTTVSPTNTLSFTTTHELGHTFDGSNGQPSSLSTFDTAMQNDWLTLNYVNYSTKAQRNPCAVLNINGSTYNGPFVGLTDPTTKNPFCSGNGTMIAGSKWVDANGNPLLPSVILRDPTEFGYTGSPMEYQPANATVGTYTYLPGWREWHAESFAIRAKSDIGSTPYIPVFAGMVANGYFACTAGPSGWVQTEYSTGKPVKTPTCQTALPKGWTVIH